MDQNTQILLGLLSAIKNYPNSTQIKENLEQLCRPFAKRLLENLMKYQQTQQTVFQLLIILKIKLV